MHRYVVVVMLALAPIAGGCGDESCPSGTMPVGDTCVSVDDGGPSTSDGGPTPDSCTPQTYYRDSDGDGFGADADTMSACGPAPTGYVEATGDCDDTDMNRAPGATEECNGLDDDCDGMLDDGLTLTSFYLDSDGDMHGIESGSVMACAAPPTFVDVADDCDDTAATRYPGADELCDGADDDCDLAMDEGLARSLGTPVDLGNGYTGIPSRRSAAVGATNTGYVVVTVTSTPRVVLRRLDDMGQVVAGSDVVVDAGGTGIDMSDVDVQVVDDAGNEAAVVTWVRGGNSVRARTVPLDGGSAGSTVTIGSGFVPRAVGALPSSLVLFNGGGGGTTWSGRLVSSATGALDGSSVVLWVGEGTLSFASAWRIQDSLVLTGFHDRRGSDADFAGYLQRMTLSPTPGAVGTPTRVVSPSMRRVLGVVPVLTRPSASAVSDGLVVLRTWSSTVDRLEVAPLQVTASGDVTVGSAWRDVVASGGPIAQVDSAGGIAHLVYTNDSPTELWYSSVAPEPGSVAGAIMLDAAYAVEGADLAMRSPTDGVVVYGRRASSGGALALRAQRLGCR